jgi:dihydroflavonol-4-reductase
VPPDPVLVTGGSGFVGGAIVRRLVADGRAVRALARGDAAAEVVASLGATPVRGDILDEDSLRAAAAGCSSIFHAAGVNAMCVRDPARMFATNVDGSANVVRAAAETGVGRVVHTSSAAAIGEAKGTVGREDTPHRGSYLSDYERSKRIAELTVLELGEKVGVDVVCVNPSSVQGPGRSTGSARLIINVVGGRLPVLIDSVVSIVDVADCTEGHVRAETRGTPGERYLLSGATIGTREAVALIQGMWGLPRRVRFVTPGLATTAGAVLDVFGRVLRRDVPLCAEVVRTIVHGHRYDGSKAVRELGLRYTPLEDTLDRTLAWYAERGLVPPRARHGRAART